jgi:hypothetical protein
VTMANKEALSIRICHARPCAGHPRLSLLTVREAWMAGTSPAMTG